MPALRATASLGATRTSDVESRSLPVPDGLDGTRVDAALAKMLGFSRTFAADVAEAGGVAHGRPCARQVRPASRRAPGSRCRGSRRRSRGSSRSRCPISASSTTTTTSSWSTSPSGVAAHPSVGWDGPDRARRPGRRRLPHRDDRRRRARRASCTASTSARAGSWSSPRPSAPTRRSSARSRSARSRRSTTRSCRGTPTRSPERSTRPSGGIRRYSWKFAVTPDGKDSVTHYETLEAFPRRGAARDPPRDRAHAPDPRAHGRAPASVRRRPALRRRPDAVGAPRPDPAVAARAAARRSRIPRRGTQVTFTSEYPADLAHALEVLRAD